MQTAFSDHDFDQLAELAHWLKGSGGTAGFHEFTDPAKELEQLARQGGADAEQITEILCEIGAITNALVVPEVATAPSQ